VTSTNRAGSCINSGITPAAKESNREETIFYLSTPFTKLEILHLLCAQPKIDQEYAVAHNDQRGMYGT
jgi:hypothetical protein